jgi:hypothetical protein
MSNSSLILTTPPFTVDHQRSQTIKLPPLQFSRLSISTSQYIPSVPLACIPIIQQIEDLSSILRPRSSESSRNKVIAVDGLDKEAVRFTIRFLHDHIAKHTGLNVRVLSEPYFQRDPESVNVPGYNEVVRHWDRLWDDVIRHPVPNSAARHGSITVPRPNVDIIPFSPLMTTERAASQMSITDAYSNESHWRWVAGYWRGCERPDITVNILDSNGTLKDSEVLRVWGDDMNTLVVTKTNSGLAPFTAKQLRRVGFEVKEWLMNG